MRNKMLIIFVCMFMFLPKNVLGKVIYDKLMNETFNFAVLRGVANNDGGYTVLGVFTDDVMPALIKYSENGEQLWAKKYEFSTISNYYSGVIRFDVEKTIIGFTQLDNGNYVVVTPSVRGILSSDGSIISIVEMEEQLQSYMGFRCENNGDNAICVGIGKSSLIGSLFKIDANNIVVDKYDISVQPAISEDESLRVGVPVSFFVNNDGNYVLETMEGTTPYLYIFDANLQQVDKKEFLINNSSITIDATNEAAYGDAYWVLGQFIDNKYLGAHIEYGGDRSISKLSYVIFDTNLSGVIKEQEFASGYVDMGGNTNQTTLLVLYECLYKAINSMTNGIRAGRYGSIIDFSFNGNYNESDIKLEMSFARLDSNLDSMDKVSLASIGRESLANFHSMHSTIIRLKNGDDVILMNNTDSDIAIGRHIRIGKRLVALPTNKSNADISFDKDVYEAGDVVKVQLRQKEGYYVDKVIIKDEDGNIIEFNNKSSTFVMPNSDVTVDVQYKKIEQVKTGILTSIILSILSLGFLWISNIKYFHKKTLLGN